MSVWSKIGRASRRSDDLPHYSAFQPDERSGEAADMIVAEVRREGDTLTFHCQAAGARVEKIFNRSMQGRQLRDEVENRFVIASWQIWQACIEQKMPIYSTLEVKDRDSRPVTIEHVYLPFRLTTDDVDMVVAAFYAWSMEGRFAIEGLLADVPDPLDFAPMIVDPSLTATSKDEGRFESI